MSLRLIRNVLRELENTSSTLDKAALIRRAGEEIPHFKDVLLYALNPYKKFNIAVVPPYDSDKSAKVTVEPGWIAVRSLLDNLASKKISGFVAKSTIISNMEEWSPSANLVFRRILLKDLRCGVGATLVNSVFPNLVPEFGVMLANTLQEHHCKKIVKKAAWWQAKKNGDRLIAIIPPRHGENRGQSSALSRNGHALLNYNNILRSLEFVVEQSEQYRNVGLVFDGEVIDKNFFNTRGTKKLAGNEAVDAVFHVFDMVSIPMWEDQTSLPYRMRRVELAKIANGSPFEMAQNLTRVPSYPVDLKLAGSLEYFDSLRDRLVKSGEEGVMIRPDELYNYKTRSSLYKHKKMLSMDCVIMEVLPGEEGKKYEHTAGRLLVKMDDGETLCYAGLKLSDAERDEMWKNRNLIAGMVCEVNYQEKTVSKQGVPKLQFPVYQRMREDKS